MVRKYVKFACIIPPYVSGKCVFINAYATRVDCHRQKFAHVHIFCMRGCILFYMRVEPLEPVERPEPLEPVENWNQHNHPLVEQSIISGTIKINEP